MISNSIVISALLATGKIECRRLHHEKSSHSLIDTSLNEDVFEYKEPELVIIGNEDLRVIEEKAYLDTCPGESFSPTSCSSGIERFESGDSNSQDTWDDAQDDDDKWQDPQFGADDSSLSWGAFGFGKTSGSPPAGLVWKRPSEMGEGLSSSPSLFGDLGKPLPYGVKQGQLGDCWFLSAIAATAEQPQRIKNVIVNTEYSDQGIFRFKFYNRGKWHFVNIDDRLPV